MDHDRASAAVFGTVFLAIFLSLLPRAAHASVVFALVGTGCGSIAFFSRALWPRWGILSRRHADDVTIA